MTDKGFTGWRFDAKDDDRDRMLAGPRSVPDAPASGLPVKTLLSAVAGLGVLAFVEGTLVWIALLWVHRLGWLAEPPGWSPVVAITAAITILRAIDRSVFTRP